MSNRPAVMVTGGARRIGAAISRAYGEAGWHVIIHYGSSRDAAEALAQSLPSAELVQCDLADSDAAESMVKAFAAKLPDWRVLINSAAVFEHDDVTLMNPDTYERAMEINAKTPARMAQAYLEKANATGGRRVIMLTDQKLANPNPDFFSYTMSKHALGGSVAMLSMGAAGPDDRIYAVAPGAILPSHDQTMSEAEISHRLNLLRRKTGPGEVAQTCLFLAKGDLESGQTIYVDSGQHLLKQDRDVIYLAREGDKDSGDQTDKTS